MGKFRLAVFNTQPPHLYRGGVERRIMETTKRLQTEAEIVVYSGTKAGFQQPTTIDNVRFVPCYSTDRNFPLDNWVFNHSLTKKALEIDADVYEAHAVSGYGFAEKLKALGVHKPLVHMIHGVLADEYEQAKQAGYASIRNRAVNYFMGRLAKLEEQAAQDASLIVTISNYSLQNIHNYYHVDSSKVRIVPNGVDIERFKPAPDREASRKQFGLGKEPCVLFVGSLIPRKGLPLLVEAAKKVVKEQPEAKFLLVGDGPLRQHLANSIDAGNLSGNFRFLSNVADDMLPAAYGCADVFVLPSIQEGQGIVLLEAQASGVPVVAFDIGGVKETVRSGETGLLAKKADSDGLADSMLRLLRDKSLREKMGQSGRDFVTESFTWDICAEKMLKVYREVLAN